MIMDCKDVLKFENVMNFEKVYNELKMFPTFTNKFYRKLHFGEFEKFINVIKNKKLKCTHRVKNVHEF